MPPPRNDLNPAKSRPNSTRKGCWTCRRHHRKCDEHKPFCRRCVDEYGVECEGYGRRRVAFRMSGPQQNAQNSQNSQALIQSRSPSVVTVPSPCSLAVVPITSSTFTATEQRLLHIFSADFAPRAAISPLQDVFSLDIAPMVMTAASNHTYVLAAVLSLSAAHVGSLEQTSSLCLHNAFSYYDKAVRLLQSVSVPTTGDDHQAYLATIFLLAWFDILVFDPDKWTIHLRMACSLINQNVESVWMTSSGRRILHSIARLDCSNALCNRAPPMLCQRAYDLLEQEPHQNVDGLLLDQQVDAECMRLHGILGNAARLSYDWTLGLGHDTADVREETLSVLLRLQDWHDQLPEALQWPAIEDDTSLTAWLSDKPPLFIKLWLHYMAITVHLYHILEPVSSGLWEASVQLAQRCLQLVRLCEEDKKDGPYRGDLSILFVLAVSGVLIDDPNDRAWIQSYLLRNGRETPLWCGYERAACLQAWWHSVGSGKRLILSQPDRTPLSMLDNGTNDKGADMKSRVRVQILYEDLLTGSIHADCHEIMHSELGTGEVS